MAVQNPLYGRELSEGEAAITYQPKSPHLTVLSNPPTAGNYLLSVGAGTLTWAAPTTDLVPEGSARLYFTPARAKAAITGAASTAVSTDLTPSRAVITDSAGKLYVSTISTGELEYLSGVTSNIQGQIAAINGVLATVPDISTLTTTTVAEGSNLYYTDTRVRAAITGAISPILTANLTASRLLVSDTGGKVSTSNVTSVEVGYLSGVTSPIQAQLAQIGTLSNTVANLTTTSVAEGNRLYFTTARAAASITGAASTVATSDLPLSRALISDTSGKVGPSTVTSTELGYLSGVTSGVQAQLNTITGRIITAGTGLTGGGNLSTNLSLGVAFEAAPTTLKPAGTASVGTANTVPRADHVHPPDSSKLDVALMGAASGVATLDSNVKVPTSQIPAITTQVGFGGETISVPYTGTTITLPLPVTQGGTGTTTATSALSALGGQPVSTVLTGISATPSSGFLVKDATGLAQVRTLQVNNPLTITNPSGAGGNPTVSLTQGDGSGLDADLLDGAHGSSYFKVDGTVSYSTGTATTIRGSISAASVGANTDITSMAAVTGIGNGSTSHITVLTTGEVGMGETTPNSYGKLAVRGGSAGTNTSSLAVITSNGNNLRADIALWSTFSNYPADVTTRRTADIVAGFNGGVWGTEYLSLNVGGAGTGVVCTERVRIDGSGNVLVGTTTTTANGGDVQVSKGITFPPTQVLCSNVNTLDDYKEGTWTPVIDSSTPGAGRVTNTYYAVFTKVGNLVTFSAFVILATLGTGGSGNLVINGLPYTSASISGQGYIGVQVPYFTGLKTALMGLTATVQPNSTQILFRGWGSAITSVPSIDFGVYAQAGTAFIVSGSYYI